MREPLHHIHLVCSQNCSTKSTGDARAPPGILQSCDGELSKAFLPLQYAYPMHTSYSLVGQGHARVKLVGNTNCSAFEACARRCERRFSLTHLSSLYRPLSLPLSYRSTKKRRSSSSGARPAKAGRQSGHVLGPTRILCAPLLCSVPTSWLAVCVSLRYAHGMGRVLRRLGHFHFK